MKNIIKLDNSPDFYLRRAQDKADSGDYIGALELLRTAESKIESPYSKKDKEIRIEIADVLSSLGLYEESNREYFKLMAHDDDVCESLSNDAVEDMFACTARDEQEECLDCGKCDDLLHDIFDKEIEDDAEDFVNDVLIGIIRNYAMMEQYAYAEYYIKTGVEKGDMWKDSLMREELDFLRAPKGSPEQTIKLLKKDDRTLVLSEAKELLSLGDTAAAKEILIEIPKSSPQYVEGANYLALIAISDGEIDQGIALAREVLDSAEDDVYALTTLIVGLHMAKQSEELAQRVLELDALDIDEWPTVAKVALCFCQIGNQSLAHKYLSKAIQYTPSDKEILLLHVLTSANLEKFSQAKSSMIMLQAIYADDAVVAYYAKELDKCIKSPFTFELIPELPKEIRRRWAQMLDKAALKCTDLDNMKNLSNAFIKLIEKSPELEMAVRYALNHENESIASQMCGLLANSPRSFILMREMLIDPYYPVIPKKEIFINVIAYANDTQRAIPLNIHHRVKWFHPKMPKTIKDARMRTAYWLVYTTMAFLDDFNDGKLNAWVSKFHKVLTKDTAQEYTSGAIAAALAVKSGAHAIFRDIESMAKLFESTTEKAEEILALVELEYGKGKKNG